MIAGIGYRLAPGCCHVCRSSDSVPTIDTRREDPGDVRRSNVYVCAPCVRAMAQALEPMVDWEVVPKGTLDRILAGAAELRASEARAAKAEGTLRELAAMLPAAEVAS